MTDIKFPSGIVVRGGLSPTLRIKTSPWRVIKNGEYVFGFSSKAKAIAYAKTLATKQRPSP